LSKAWMCELKAGDALFLPRLMPHSVVSVPGQNGLSLAVNFWFDPQKHGDERRSADV